MPLPNCSSLPEPLRQIPPLHAGSHPVENTRQSSLIRAGSMPNTSSTPRLRTFAPGQAPQAGSGAPGVPDPGALHLRHGRQLRVHEKRLPRDGDEMGKLASAAVGRHFGTHQKITARIGVTLSSTRHLLPALDDHRSAGELRPFNGTLTRKSWMRGCGGRLGGRSRPAPSRPGWPGPGPCVGVLLKRVLPLILHAGG